MQIKESQALVGNCQAKHPRTGKAICERGIWGSGPSHLCIFHLETKPTDEFKREFLAEIKSVNESGAKEFDGQCFIFPSNLKVEELTFQKDATFDYIRCDDDVSFANTVFRQKASFEHAKFAKNISFKESMFRNNVSFGKAQFGHGTSFYGVRFFQETSFREATFGDRTIFDIAQFLNRAKAFEGEWWHEDDLGYARFGNDASFVATQFGNATNFAHTVFGDRTSFERAHFGIDTSFELAQFGNKASFEDATFEMRPSFYQAKFLESASFDRTQFGNGASFWETILGHGASFDGANLSGANLSGAKLQGANLRRAIFLAADLSGADLEKASVRETLFVNTNLSDTKNLESCEHYGPSFIDHKTIANSGELPLVFLRGCGLPDSLINYLPSLLNEQPIQFYSCFISYSSKDEGFAKRIYADLQERGVRCWFAPEDLKIGDKFRQRIDDTIRIYDKLLLILSERSISSPWVEDEVEAALERERKEYRLVLFPINIDDAVLNSERAWAASLRRTRHIGDFQDWKTKDAYQRAFEHLVRDLQSETS